MDQALTKQKIKELRAMVSEGDRVAIVLQDDPDPDAMASGIALRTLLGRNKQTTPLFAFKPVTRPENLTMVHLLEIEIQPATPKPCASSTRSRWSTFSRRSSARKSRAPISRSIIIPATPAAPLRSRTCG